MYFIGVMYIDLPQEKTEAEVKQLIDDQHHHDNWLASSLKRVGKVKQKKALR